MDRPLITLFTLMSVDGKVNTGESDCFCLPKDLALIEGTKSGIQCYSDLNPIRGTWCLTTGKALIPCGVNTADRAAKFNTRLVVIDRDSLTRQGVEFLCSRYEQVVLVTGNARHPAFSIKQRNLNLEYSIHGFDPYIFPTKLKQEYKCEELILHAGPDTTALFLRERLIDQVELLVAPILIGGVNTPSLIGGDSVVARRQLAMLGQLELIRCDTLPHSYLHLWYKVINKPWPFD